MQFCYTKITIFLRSAGLAVSLFLCLNGVLLAQECADLDLFTIGDRSKIDWNVTPAFDLPFRVIYGVPLKQGQPGLPLSHGFNSITDNSFQNAVEIGQRTQIYYGNAFLNTGQPWELHRSPWGNDLAAYAQKWQQDHRNLSAEGGNTALIDPALFCFDIERVWRFDFEILQQKANPAIPAAYRNLSNDAFFSYLQKGYAGAVCTLCE